MPAFDEAEQVELAAEVQELRDFGSDVGEDEAAAAGGGGGDKAKAASGGSVPVIGSLLDFESALNLRLATLTRTSGRAFRAIAVYVPLQRTSLNFEVTFEDIASGARLVCRLDEVKSSYMDWSAQFCASFLALFLPTLEHPNATLLMNAIFSARPGRPPPPPGSYHPRLNEDADHLFFSYTKLREIISKKKKDTALNPQLLTVAVLNAYAEEWKNFISTPGSCLPQDFLQASFNFQPKGGLLNKELLQVQLATAADCILALNQRQAITGERRRGADTPAPPHSLSNVGKNTHRWSLIFVSAPVRAAAGVSAIPPMQDLLTGQFVEPLSLSSNNVIYIIGSGTAANSFSKFPLQRKGQCAFSILLKDIESQLGQQRRQTLTATLTQAMDCFSRLTWMGIMKAETGEERQPHPTNAFYRLQRRTVQREIVPSFLEGVFSPANRLGGGGGAPSAGGPDATTAAKASQRLEAHLQGIYNNPDRLHREEALRAELQHCRVFFVTLASADVTAARRADNPFSSKNGITEAQTQLWSTLALPNPPPMALHEAEVDEKSGEVTAFVEPEDVLPVGLPLGPRDAPNPKDRAAGAILISWDVKRVLLFLRTSKKLRRFLFNGGRIWCAQYAQYLLKGFNHLHLGTMERTLLQYHDGPLRGPMHPLAKLKLIFEMQLEVAVNTRQLCSLLHRMDGLLASTEMESNGLQVESQTEVSRFANRLRLDHERLEKDLLDRILDFTKHMDDEVRQRINFRSPQDISTIIYGGALCRHLGMRFVPVRPTRYPITSLLPHAACHVTGTTLPEVYTQPAALLGETSGTAANTTPELAFTAAQVEGALRRAQELTRRATMEHLLPATAVVVLTVRARLGGLLEQVCLYCPGAPGDTPELNVRVAVDDILPMSDHPDLVTVPQLRELIVNYKPLKQILPHRRLGKKSYELRNVLILTNCTHEKLEPLVDTGVVRAIVEALLPPAAGRDEPGLPFERVCFADLHRAFPPPPQGVGDSFESDFTALTGSSDVTFSAKVNWDVHAGELMALSGLEGVLRALLSHCAAGMGTPRDAFRNTHPVPAALPEGVHGQEQASTPGMLWMVTPPNLRPILYRFLRGRTASSGADAMERVTVLLSPYKEIDLSFFAALQQLRFTEKKLQLFDEGCLFRAVLPENHDRVHGELCHCVTATGRLSSQAPNLQNIPKEQDLRRLIVSRFGRAGRMVEADYSQLEVVVLAALSRDSKMMQELREKIDFHCLRVSLMTKEPYADVVRKTKVEKDPGYVQLRQQAKVFSFQRQYGAGIATIATTTGLTEHEVERLIAAEESHYRELGHYYQLVKDCVEAGADRLLRMRTLDAALTNANARRVLMLTEPLYYFVVPTGSKFDFTKDRKSVPRLKNYPVQGLAGEIVQIMCGKIVRLFFEKKNYNNKAFLVNTVHDCVWVDCHEDVAADVVADLKQLMGNTQQVMDTLYPEMKLDVPFSAEVHQGPSLGELSS
ncbi:mitochondrial DNA polymerase I protein C [Strigomonas culicis]|uniref:Mitochondrial DNA polymerase I protein C n=1 Tax=Strigomonas culicis TaxID=28005 RepID=S9TV48_9TRYP|nr:mitochondrial DNA polymerase I protein C [Strigomonas culicis]|eukprot:EPY20433.1 mitochondrial DNA polymerase I protein C [Strigomonas culicis]